MLDKYGFTETEQHLNEWNLFTERRHRDSVIASAKTLSFMLMMQKTDVSVMCFYDAGLGYSDYRALINPDSGYPYRCYYTFMMFNSLYRLKGAVKVENEGERVFCAAARDGREGCVVLANASAEDMRVSLDISGMPLDRALVLRIDEENRYTATGEDVTCGELIIPAYGCVEIKLFDLS